MLSMSEKAFACLVVVLLITVAAHGSTDVLHYSATLEPDIEGKSVKGSVLIRVLTTSNMIEFDCGDLTIESVQENNKPLQFSVNEHKLRVSLPKGKREREVAVK